MVLILQDILQVQDHQYVLVEGRQQHSLQVCTAVGSESFSLTSLTSCYELGSLGNSMARGGFVELPAAWKQ